MSDSLVSARNDVTTRPEINSLQPGDPIEVDHEIKVGLKVWHKTTTGTVERFERAATACTSSETSTTNRSAT